MINFNAFLETLPIAGKGLAGIFIVIIIIVVCVLLLELAFPVKNNEDK